MKYVQFIILFVFINGVVLGQKQDSSFYDISAYVVLDSIVISAEKKGFNIDEFIKIIQEDQSVELAFQNIRSQEFDFSNSMIFYNSKGNIQASYFSKNRQFRDGDCRRMKILEEKVHGKFFKKNGLNKYYTAKLYDRIFYSSTEPCSSFKTTNNKAKKRSPQDKIIENRIGELKKLIYSPGQKANVPLIGNKTAIFNRTMAEYYDFSLRSDFDQSGNSIYVFKASVKPYLNVEFPNSTVVKFLEIFVDKENLNVLGRKYKLHYSAGIYQFDISMTVDLGIYNGTRIPLYISYDGYWKIVGKKREDCKFIFKVVN